MSSFKRTNVAEEQDDDQFCSQKSHVFSQVRDDTIGGTIQDTNKTLQELKATLTELGVISNPQVSQKLAHLDFLNLFIAHKFGLTHDQEVFLRRLERIVQEYPVMFYYEPRNHETTNPDEFRTESRKAHFNEQMKQARSIYTGTGDGNRPADGEYVNSQVGYWLTKEAKDCGFKSIAATLSSNVGDCKDRLKTIQQYLFERYRYIIDFALPL